MGLSLLAYLLLASTGVVLFQTRITGMPRPEGLRSLHYLFGGILVLLVLLLLAIGIVGTLGHFGTLGHSSHLIAGIIVVVLVLLSAGSALLIDSQRPWMRSLHIGTNITLFLGLVWVSLTGWDVVQKYLP